ncbi:MAG: pyrroloquinoline quinone-dependent dehydrogenase [Gammaproteobacteria bacterium]|nr:MAG: pyrroloquinoline quinone-dependent dehydrogenase [Gammaproteobacteria bacterium]
MPADCDAVTAAGRGAAPTGLAHRRAPSRIMPHMRCPHAGRGGRAGASRPASAAEALRSLLVRLMAALPCLASSGALAQSPDASDWGYYGGDAFGQRFSSLDEINRGNVSRLKVVWTYRTGELGAGFTRAGKLTFEATPVLAFGLLYVETGTNIVIALDPESGHERWRVDPHIDRARHYAEASSRGVSVWESTDAGQTGLCRRRIFTGTLDARLLALDAQTGRPCVDFGGSGQVDLTRGLRIRDVGAYLVTSPPAVYANAVIVGSAIGDNRATDLERGVIRAFDARSGAQLWSFDPLPDSPSHPAAADWDLAQAAGTGAGNAWGVMTVDEEHGLVLVPTGSASPDFYGGRRVGSNRFANSLLALDARSGKLVWHRQLIHHDLWDYDLAAQPVLGDIEVQGVPVPAVIQATKTGMLYVFERTGGQPLVPISERPVPASHVPGEQAWPTQPFSSLPALTPQRPVLPSDAWGLTFWDRGKCRDLIASLRNEGIFTPPDTRGTLLSPGYIGGVNWGGMAFDEQRQRVIAAVNHLPMVVTLMSHQELEREGRSEQFPHSEFAPQTGAPYGMRREPLLSPWDLPCTAPPWGTLVSVDLRRARIVWQVPLGSTEGLTPWFVPSRDFGMPNMGGPIATDGELVFVSAAMDSYLRAFDVETGRELWKYKLPAGGQATPMTYRAGRDQHQYLVISAGGHGGLGTPRGDYLIAFALPAGAAARP